MFAALGNKVDKLHRWKIGNIELDSNLAEGEFRYPNIDEINSLAKDKYETNKAQKQGLFLF